MVRVRVPATTANLGPGYDILGLALTLYNTVEMEKADRFSVEIEGEGADSLPRDEANIAYQAAQELFKAVSGKPVSFKLKLVNEIPLARGLGSSAAARIGALVAANKLAGDRLDQSALLTMAAKLEGHPDNVTPALVGGLTATALQNDRVTFLKFAKVRDDLKVVAAIPDFEVSTNEARKVLPKNVSLADYVSSGSNILFTIASLSGEGDPELLALSMQDRVHQPYRAKLIPGMEDVFRAAKEAGAQGVALSGSGSTIGAFSIGNKEDRNEEIGRAMVHAFEKAGPKCYYKILDVDQEGAVCL
jgi:homoserine kinase